MNLQDNFLEQEKKFVNDLRRYKSISFGTLGPEGTTSHYSLQFLLKDSLLKGIEVSNIILQCNFDLVYDDLLEGRIDLALIPNAYRNITEMYWDLRLRHVYSFLLKTPFYGLATRNEERLSIERKNISIASCSPVKCLVSGFVEELGLTTSYDIVQAESTTHAAMLLKNHEVDFAVTNQTSASRVGVKIVSSLAQAEVVWSVFARKDFGKDGEY